MSQPYHCAKCGGDCTVEGLMAENSARPDVKVKMVRCVCKKCGFMELRIDEAGFAQVLGKTEEKQEKD